MQRLKWWLNSEQIGFLSCFVPRTIVARSSAPRFFLNNFISNIVKFKLLPVLLLILGAWFMLTNSMRDPNNPPTGKTGAPGENTCSTQPDCHTGGSFAGTVSISGVPDTVLPNTTYTITLTNASNAIRAGFQLTCWDGSNAMCGTLTAGTGVSIGSGAAGKKYARQSAPKNLVSGSASWNFNWKAPLTASGNKATFYFASLCSNNNGQKTGDNAIQSNKTVVLKTTTPAIEPAQEAAVKFFPTLVQSNTLYLELLEAEKGQITVFDLNGKMVLQQSVAKTNTLTINDLPKGVYTAHIEAEGKIATKKFVVE